ncbi:MAG: hypothetical protein GY754_33900 [bacterium]|nr:hypothetical protein [bacterium]
MNTLHKKMFSMPLYAGINEEQFEEFKGFLKEYAHLVYDIYFTLPLAPFAEDAVGGIQQGNATGFNIYNDLEKILSLQEESGVTLSATFNNIFVSPENPNLESFIENFTPVYEMGIRSITIPFSSWSFAGNLKNKFPGISIKNTVLWKLRTAREFWNSAEAGFDYINLDRVLLRNQAVLWEIHEARQAFHRKTGKYIYLSVLANETPCRGYCPFREEHSSLAAGHKKGILGFPSHFTICLYDLLERRNTENPGNALKLAFAPPYKEDFEKVAEVVDVFKMFGRLVGKSFNQSMAAIKNYSSGKGFFPDFEALLNNIEEKRELGDLVANWREKIEDCNFNCWKCNLCDRVFTQLTEEEQRTISRLLVC